MKVIIIGHLKHHYLLLYLIYALIYAYWYIVTLERKIALVISSPDCTNVCALVNLSKLHIKYNMRGIGCYDGLTFIYTKNMYNILWLLDGKTVFYQSAPWSYFWHMCMVKYVLTINNTVTHSLLSAWIMIDNHTNCMHRHILWIIGLLVDWLGVDKIW